VRQIGLQCRAATIFGEDGSIDEDLFRQYLQRFVDNGIDVYLASAGSGEGHALSWEELRRVYEIGVAVGKGRIQVNANPPERHTARGTIEQSLHAAAAGVDVVNIYQPTNWHGYRAIGGELRAYYETVLNEVKHPVALAPHPIIGQAPSAALVADLCRRYPQIVAVNLVGQSETYFLELKAALTRDVPLYVDTRGLPNTLGWGAAGIIGGNLNILPATYRAYADAWALGDLASLTELYRHMSRADTLMATWSGPNSRAIKMFMRACRLPGWAGGVRPPCLLPSDAEIARFGGALRALGIPELDALA
jgi:4-hydroxy-tetrahydrodipicolinate synthase